MTVVRGECVRVGGGHLGGLLLYLFWAINLWYSIWESNCSSSCLVRSASWWFPTAKRNVHVNLTHRDLHFGGHAKFVRHICTVVTFPKVFWSRNTTSSRVVWHKCKADASLQEMNGGFNCYWSNDATFTAFEGLLNYNLWLPFPHKLLFFCIHSSFANNLGNNATWPQGQVSRYFVIYSNKTTKFTKIVHPICLGRPCCFFEN